MTSNPAHTSRGLPFWSASFLLPGWGQLCQARACGFLWMACGVAAYWVDLRLGAALHALCILDAWAVARARS